MLEEVDKSARMAAGAVLFSKYEGSLAEMVRLSDWELSANTRQKVLITCIRSVCTVKQVVTLGISHAEISNRRRHPNGF